MREHKAINSRCTKVRISTVCSNIANDSFNLFVSAFVDFSINCLKENAENFNYYPTLLRRKVELYLFLSTHREWESFFCRFFQCCQQRLRSRWALFISSVLCLVNLLARTIFEKFCFLFFSINELLFIYRQNWSREKIPKSQNSDKADSFSSTICGGKHSFERTKRQLQ